MLKRELARPSDFKNWRREFAMVMEFSANRVILQEYLGNDFFDWMSVIAVESLVAWNF